MIVKILKTQKEREKMIIESKKEKICLFKEIKTGEVFKNESNYFMKTDEENCIEGYGDGAYKINAIQLSNGNFTNFNSSDKVQLLKCKLIIE